MDPLREQYEKYPYPPISAIALPRHTPNERLSFGYGAKFAFKENRGAKGKRVLVIGAGTIEPLHVALANPLAEEIIAIDFSSSSLRTLRLRLFVARLSHLFLRPFSKRLPKITLLHADFLSLNGGMFDYILASNVLHHLEDPAQGLKLLSSWLKPEGLMRVVTYPKASRIWMREAKKWFLANDLSTKTAAQAFQVIKQLPKHHPARVTFENHPEIHKSSGLIDAFFNQRENPLSPLQWWEAANDAELKLIGEDQTESSQSSFLNEILPEVKTLSSWEKLQILDDTLELCANPVLWFKKADKKEEIRRYTAHTKHIMPTPMTVLSKDLVRDKKENLINKTVLLPSASRFELACNLKRCEAILSAHSIDLDKLLDKLRKEVGSRTKADSEEVLHGLSISDYDYRKLLEIPAPWDDSDWNIFERSLDGKKYSLFCKNETCRGNTLGEQANWAQAKFGAMSDLIEITIQ